MPAENMNEIPEQPEDSTDDRKEKKTRTGPGGGTVRESNSVLYQPRNWAIVSPLIGCGMVTLPQKRPHCLLGVGRQVKPLLFAISSKRWQMVEILLGKYKQPKS